MCVGGGGDHTNGSSGPPHESCRALQVVQPVERLPQPPESPPGRNDARRCRVQRMLCCHAASLTGTEVLTDQVLNRAKVQWFWGMFSFRAASLTVSDQSTLD